MACKSLGRNWSLVKRDEKLVELGRVLNISGVVVSVCVARPFSLGMSFLFSEFMNYHYRNLIAENESIFNFFRIKYIHFP